MIIQTSTCDFLIEDSGRINGCISVFSDSLEEIQRFFGSSEIEYSDKSNWRFKICTCKQDLANALILMVKEINYSDFSLAKYQAV
jgi:intein-encoded DNA endonuclease-like protein